MNECTAEAEWKSERTELLNTIKRQEDYASKLTKRFKILQDTLLRQQNVLDQYQKTLLKVRFPLHAIREEQRSVDVVETSDSTGNSQPPLSSINSSELCSRRQEAKPAPNLEPAPVVDDCSIMNESMLNSGYEENTENMDPLDNSSDDDEVETIKENAKSAESAKPQWIQCKRNYTMACKDFSRTKKYKIDESMKLHVPGRLANMDFPSPRNTLLPKTKQSDYSYVEVVRNRDVRATLPAHDCRDCSKYYDAIAKMDFPMKSSDAYDMVDSHKMKCSRHRARFEPYQTPDDFWRLSFPDSPE
uniref:Uncharacterized protein AlNc14C48G3845 n=1 Tax=Albugo laibachii Nc14 TaxID=890382 RepID=F0WAY4_9STRA|nr:conserved hypothetical protein [Albugo laibachii Nc14]CCA18421.1 conserved hypothetical protein [Albugo laibachii Nc14]|eukprot:CCA18421.1 conserved hypothetical protein [Albugo laibachii Nc14]